MSRNRAAFTLIEIMLAIAMAVLVIALAIPVMVSTFTGKELEDSYKEFEDFVQTARKRTQAESRNYVMIWHKDGISLEPESPAAEDIDAQVDMYAFQNAKISLDRPVALEKEPLAEWTFWRSGLVEPVRVIYEGDLGTWVAEYDALSARGRVLEMNPN